MVGSSAESLAGIMTDAAIPKRNRSQSFSLLTQQPFRAMKNVSQMKEYHTKSHRLSQAELAFNVTSFIVREGILPLSEDKLVNKADLPSDWRLPRQSTGTPRHCNGRASPLPSSGCSASKHPTKHA
jgi:hypothetical protein